MIQLNFKNVVSNTSFNLKHVQTVEWKSVSNESVITNNTSLVGTKVQEITIKGYLNYSMLNSAINAQVQLETNLRSIGIGTLQYTDSVDFENVRFVSLDFAEFRGNPIGKFTIVFKTNQDNIHAHEDTKIGSVFLNESNGFEQPEISDVISSQGDDGQLNSLKSRTFSIKGNIIGATLDAVNILQNQLISEIENKSTITLTLSSQAASPGIFTVRPKKLDFSSPRIKDDTTARSYSFECSTHDDYSKEPYTLGEYVTSFAGISIDVVTGADNKRDIEYADAGPIYIIKSESFDVSGKKYFPTYGQYEDFRSLFNPVPQGVYFYTSISGNILELLDVNVGKYERDGNYESDDSKRYSASITLSFKWTASVDRSNYEFATSHFGVSWYKIENVSFGVGLDDFGNVSSRNVNVSGSVLGVTAFNILKGKVGTKVDYDTTYDNLYVSNVSINSVEAINFGGTQQEVYSVSITASQLDSNTQAFHYLTGIFELSNSGGTGTSYSAENILFDRVNNRTKSLSNRFDSTTLKFKVTSINLSISGEVFSNDNNGTPSDSDKFVLLFNKIDSLLSAPLSDSVAFNQNSNELLPTNNDIHFMLTNMNIGGWDAFTDEVTGARRWKQTISLSATAVFDLSGGSTGNNDPDTVETKSENRVRQSAKYTQIQILGFGTVFKRIGTTPEKHTITYQKSWRNSELYRAANLGSLDFGLNDVSHSMSGSASPFVTRDVESNNGLVNRHTVEYTATGKI